MDNTENGYIDGLQKLDFQIENQSNSSVFFVDKVGEYIQENKSPYIKRYWK